MRFSSFRANLSRTSRTGGMLRLFAIYEHVLRRLLRPRYREVEYARGFTRDEVRYSNLPPGGAIEVATVS